MWNVYFPWFKCWGRFSELYPEQSSQSGQLSLEDLLPLLSEHWITGWPSYAPSVYLCSEHLNTAPCNIVASTLITGQSPQPELCLDSIRSSHRTWFKKEKKRSSVLWKGVYNIISSSELLGMIWALLLFLLRNLNNWTFMGKVLFLFCSSLLLLFPFGSELTEYIFI